MLPDASKLVIDFGEILTKVGKHLEKFKYEIHGVLSDACVLETCCVTNDQQEVTCFVMNADNLTMLCREGDVESNDS